MAKVGAIQISDELMQKALQGKAEGSNYTGAGDNLLDFGSASSFLDENKTGKKHQVKIQNTGTEDIRLALFPAFFTDPALIKTGIAVDAILADGEITVSANKKAVVSGAPRPVVNLLGYLKNNPTRIQSIHLKVDAASQLDESFLLRSESPFASAREVQRYPSDYQKSSDSNQNVIVIDDISDWVLSDSNALIYTVRAGRTVNISFTFGTSLDASKGLEKKATEAAINVAVMYTHSAQ